MATPVGSGTTLAHLVAPVATVFLAAAISLWVGRRRWGVRGARTFAVLLVVGGVVWQSLTIAHVLAANEAVLAFVVVADKFVGMVTSALFVVFVSQYTNSTFHRRPVVRGVIALQLGGFLLLWATNPWHGLLVAGVSTATTPFVYAGMQRGPLYFLLLVVNYTLLSISYYLVVDFLLTTRDGAQWKVALLTLGAVSVGTFNVLSIVDVMPLAGFNYGSYGALPFLVCTTVSVFRLGLLDIVPVARKTLVETLTDPVIVVDESRRVADYNRAAADLWPTLDDHVGDPLAAACPALADRLAFPDGVETRSDDISLPGRSDERHFSVLISPVRGERRPGAVGYSILVRDVTELEASRRELERQNERLDRVAATISHDLRNPLNVASGRLELLRRELDGNEAAGRHARKIEQAHDRMGQIVDEVLTLAREGRDVDERAAVDLADTAREAWDTVETDGARLEVATAGTVWAERSSLRTIFENLFRNAVEHATARGSEGTAPERSDGGETTVRVGCLEDGFFVEDDGPGIPDAKRGQVFEHGYTTTDEGTGFGLAIVETVAERHGWRVELADAPGGGARFVFRGVWVELAD